MASSLKSWIKEACRGRLLCLPKKKSHRDCKNTCVTRGCCWWWWCVCVYVMCLWTSLPESAPCFLEDRVQKCSPATLSRVGFAIQISFQCSQPNSHSVRLLNLYTSSTKKRKGECMPRGLVIIQRELIRIISACSTLQCSSPTQDTHTQWFLPNQTIKD